MSGQDSSLEADIGRVAHFGGHAVGAAAGDIDCRADKAGVSGAGFVSAGTGGLFEAPVHVLQISNHGCECRHGGSSKSPQ